MPCWVSSARRAGKPGSAASARRCALAFRFLGEAPPGVTLAGAVQRLLQAPDLDGLQQIVDRADVERGHRVLGVRGAEHHHRAASGGHSARASMPDRPGICTSSKHHVDAGPPAHPLEHLGGVLAFTRELARRAGLRADAAAAGAPSPRRRPTSTRRGAVDSSGRRLARRGASRSGRRTSARCSAPTAPHREGRARPRRRAPAALHHEQPLTTRARAAEGPGLLMVTSSSLARGLIDASRAGRPSRRARPPGRV